MHSAIVYELHIFKDVDNTSWINPRVHTFQLSEHAALPVIRSNEAKGGLSNLRRCSPEQLSYIQTHLAVKNEALKSAREAEKKEQKAAEARRKKEAKKLQDKRDAEIETWRLEMNEKVSKLQEEFEKERNDRENKTEDEDEDKDDPKSALPFGPGSFPYPHPPFPYAKLADSPNYNIPQPYNCPPRFRPRNGRSPPPPPPPPPPPARPFYPVPYRERPEVSRLQMESDWNLESIDLDLIPIVAKLKAKKLKNSSLDSKSRHLNDNDYDYYPRRRGGSRVPRLSYQLADSAKVEIAVVYSRVVMTAVPNVPNSRVREPVVYYSGASDVGGSVYEYNSEADMDEVIAKKEEGDEEENEDSDEEGSDAEEEDLEIVKGFRHCHSLEESMSGCCLGREC